jgi:hypothetical protein
MKPDGPEAMITAIPTDYNGCRFRSRLEAKWACFFDIMRWKWEYEPFDLNGWIPDFALLGVGSAILVEVKPLFFRGEEPILAQTQEKIKRATQNLPYEVLLVGATFPEPKDDYFTLGYLYDPDQNWGGEQWDKAFVLAYPRGPRVLDLNVDFCHASGDWTGRIYGRHDKLYHTLRINSAAAVGFENIWRHATNAVQWRAA